jgi:macrolide transport system ATP-binding/permease protein
VGLTGQLPLGLSSSDTDVTIPGYDFAESDPRNINYVYVGEGYLETMDIDLVEGRTYTRADDADSPPVIVVNKRFADRFWPGESALGKTVQTGGASAR